MGIDLTVPDAADGRTLIVHNVIFDELCAGQVLNSLALGS